MYRGRQEESYHLDFDCVGIDDGGIIPFENTRRGQNRSPEFLLWNLSPRAATVAITLEDLSHPIQDFTHWIIWNIPASNRIKGNIPPGKEVPGMNGARQGLAYGRHCYAGPKPRRGRTHVYRYSVYVLDCAITLSPRATKKAFFKKAGRHIIQAGSITGEYE